MNAWVIFEELLRTSVLVFTETSIPIVGAGNSRITYTTKTGTGPLPSTNVS